jgi:hypothetical protein
MSFDPRDPLAPDVPPPASAPPPPPSQSDEEHVNSQHVPLLCQSYQQQQQLPDQLIPPSDPINSRKFNSTGFPPSRAAQVPNITHYDGGAYEEDYSTNWLQNSSGSMLRGDAAIQPNTGLKNSALGDGTALVEIVWKLRWINIIASTLAIMSEIFGIIFKLFDPAKAVLAGYLTFFSLMLLTYETRFPELEKIVKDNFGLLCHPIGRALFLILLSSLAVGQWTLMDVLIGITFFGNAMYTIHTFIFYPEYRRLHEEEEIQTNGTESTWWSRKSWATPDFASSTVIASTIAQGLMNERDSLLHSS